MYSRLKRELFTLFVLGLSVLTPALGRANVVDDWNAIAQQAIVVNAGRGGAVAVVDYTYVHIAIYDAVNAIDGRYSVFAVQPLSSPVGGSPEAAAATAAYLTLKWMFPTQQAYLDGVYASYMAGIPAGSPKTTQGRSLGPKSEPHSRHYARAMAATRAFPHLFGSGPGVYQLTPGCPAPPASPVSPWLAQLKPFAIESPSQFRADGPPSLTVKQWADDMNETGLYGALYGSLRTFEETRTGQFYAENPGSQFGRNVRGIAPRPISCQSRTAPASSLSSS